MARSGPVLDPVVGVLDQPRAVTRGASGSGRGPAIPGKAHARERGARLLRLETNRALAEAIALYRNAGFGESASVQR